MLARINREDQDQVARVLEWLSFSLRPLLLEEIAEVFILNRDAVVPFDEEDRLLTPDAVMDFLRGLVTEIPRHIPDYDVDHHARRGTDVVEVRLAHFSIKEYLVSSRMPSSISTTFAIEEIDAHIHITESCLAYHLHVGKTTLATRQLLRQYQLWEYVVKYWPKHLDLISSDKCTQPITQGALQVFTRGSQALLNMARIRNPDAWEQHPSWDTAANQLAPPLYHASSIDALRLAELVLETDNASVIDEISAHSRHGFALQAAAYHGHQVIVQFLLDKGAEVNAQGGEYGNALQAAAFSGSEAIVQLLLDKGADVNAQGGIFGNAFQAAGYRGREAIVQLLLDKGADVNAQGGYFGNAFQAAAIDGHEAIVQLLLDKGADVNAKGGEFGNALQAAVCWGEWETGELLLFQGAEVDPPGPEWEELLTRVQGGWEGATHVNRLRKFQENPTVEGLRRMRKEQDEEWKREKKAWEEEKRKDEESRIAEAREQELLEVAQA